MNQTTEELLVVLDEERQKFGQSDREKILSIVNELIDREYYVDTQQTLRRRSEGIEHPILAMVEGYGANWNRYNKPHNCPNCGTDLCDRTNGPPFKKEVGNGGRCHCPECKDSWNR